ncbi:hypothetical protein [Streptosporangium amethystogenes]|uniref:hypothetical protein n=1 Tax=Streptosporangium amethystogenes TaxID=2002 RepID=UPI0004BE1213|nr:hypothetical protein [Streptosporangium amethystogenes]KUJ65427.1 hypothetical protein ACZ90_48010 [Streptomyces albus subsp. albus]
MSASQDPTRREDLLFMLLHGGAASNSIASHVVDMAIGEALDQQKAELAALRARVAELEADITHDDPCRPCGCSKRFERYAWGCPTLPADDVPVLPQPRQAEDPHDSVLHHDYALGRDLPAIPRQTTGRCPSCSRTFEDCTCGGAA